MDSKSDNIEIISHDKTDEVIEENFTSLISRHQIELETQMKVSDFIFYFVNLLYYKCQKIKFNRSGWYIDSRNGTNNKKATIKPINKDDNKCFQHATTVALNFDKIGKNSQKTSKIKHFLNKYNRE